MAQFRDQRSEREPTRSDPFIGGTRYASLVPQRGRVLPARRSTSRTARIPKAVNATFVRTPSRDPHRPPLWIAHERDLVAFLNLELRSGASAGCVWDRARSARRRLHRARGARARRAAPRRHASGRIRTARADARSAAGVHEHDGAADEHFRKPRTVASGRRRLSRAGGASNTTSAGARARGLGGTSASARRTTEQLVPATVGNFERESCEAMHSS